MPNLNAEFESLTATLTHRPTLLLHACCAPCASASLERLAPHFDITLYFYNPNIQPREEYDRRLGELHRLLAAMPLASLIVGEYDFPDREWGDCRECLATRIRLTAQRAALGGFDYFATTLSISPHKDAALLHALALESQRTLALESQHALALPLDLKKRGGFARSVELSRELNLYRQRYCGCLAGK